MNGLFRKVEIVKMIKMALGFKTKYQLYIVHKLVKHKLIFLNKI